MNSVIRLFNDLQEGEVIVLKKSDDKVLQEIFLDDDGVFRVNELTNRSKEDPYEQHEITNLQAMHLLTEYVGTILEF